MRIENVEFHTVHVSPLVDWTFVQLRTDDGLSGLGELNPSVRRSGNLPRAREMADSLVGRDPRRIRQISDLRVRLGGGALAGASDPVVDEHRLTD